MHRGCPYFARKKRFETKEGAEAALGLRLATGGISWKFVNAYSCRHCGGWHLGHKSKVRPKFLSARVHARPHKS